MYDGELRSSIHWSASNQIRKKNKIGDCSIVELIKPLEMKWNSSNFLPSSMCYWILENEDLKYIMGFSL